jgi:hypothetical protein
MKSKQGLNTRPDINCNEKLVPESIWRRGEQEYAGVVGRPFLHSSSKSFAVAARTISFGTSTH